MASKKLFDFDFTTGKPYKELNLEEDAHYTDHSLRFTKTDDHGNPVKWSMGRGVYYQSVGFGASFNTDVKFKVTSINTQCGDGLAFYMVPEDYKYPTKRGGNFAIFGSPGIFAVVFHIDSNPGNITLGICISERTPKSFIQFPADSFLDTDLKLIVSYDSITEIISASVYNGDKTYRVPPYKYNLSNFLPPKVEVGLGSSTSEYVGVHDALSWSFSLKDIMD